MRIDSLGKGLTNALCRLALVRTDFRAGAQAHGDILGQFGLLSERLKRLPVLLGDDRQPCLMRLGECRQRRVCGKNSRLRQTGANQLFNVRRGVAEEKGRGRLARADGRGDLAWEPRQHLP